MDDAGEVRDDIRCPDNDLGKDISARFEKDEQLLVSSSLNVASILHWRNGHIRCTGNYNSESSLLYEWIESLNIGSMLCPGFLHSIHEIEARHPVVEF